jgi:hypothetical protein
MDDVIDPVTGNDRNISNIVSPLGDTEGRLCTYNCVTWKVINLQTVITQVGAIGVGAAIVVQTTEMISTEFGIPTVSGDTEPKELEQRLKRMRGDGFLAKLAQPLKASMFSTALIICALGFTLKYKLANKIDSDGYDTVDYYTVYALLYSVILVTLIRLWHPFNCRPQVFTQPMWSQGWDSFVVARDTVAKWSEATFGEGQFDILEAIGDHLVKVKVDLYQWMHLDADERCELLINRCRRPGANAAEGDQMKLLAHTQVKLHHAIKMGSGEVIESEKKVIAPGGTLLTMIHKIDADTIKVSGTIEGRLEKVVIKRVEALDYSEEWEKLESTFIAEGEDDLANARKMSMASGGKMPAAKGTKKALQEKLLTLEDRVKALSP